MLQTRVGKRTGAAALKMAVDMTKGSGKGKTAWKISQKEAVMRVTAEHLDQVLHPQFANKGVVLAKGLAASPGAAVGKVYFTADDAADAADNGEDVILVRNETSPEDVHGMMVSKGILTARGGLVSHAAVVARGWGTPAIVGAEAVKIDGKQFSVGNVTVKEGDVISIDGTSGEVVLGELKLEASKPPKEFDVILKWADVIRKGKLGVRANADTGEDAKNARELGAEGIGLCRTEHMFLAPDRCARSRRKTSPPSSARCRVCRSRCVSSTHRCTSSCPRCKSSRSRRPPPVCRPWRRSSSKPRTAGRSSTR
jgi:pyruvate,orthophosphate dikinase